MEDCMAELATIDRLMKERAHLDDVIALLEHGNIDEALRILKRDRADIDAVLKMK